MFGAVLIAALAGSAPAAAAGPVYLECAFSSDGTNWSVQVAIDEANQRVTISHPSGEPAVVRGLFSPYEVVATERIGNETQTWTFNRVDLSVRNTTSFTTGATVGACKIKPAPAKRAF